MNRLLPLILAAAALTAGASQALAQDPAPGRQCFRVSQMDGHRVADPKTLYVGVRNKDVFRIDMHGACLAGADIGDPLVVETVGGSDLVCKPIDLDLKVAGTIGLSPCIVKSITKLTPPQIASLPRKLKP
ncbi:hypothetical protein JKL49_16500 [Phenylobacterium sp. 20VBR1]|uniref:NusG domain-containing protein n=1 Tax=Phenylobacterium glaciei TaxID=2803784 RepID=A0A941D4Z0_9CAUL|nr:DUF6491 family protein [Phenylobacterium glaciei]MBR7620996.1 hypothetical protein [Phenylobacterium glaciei]